MQPQPETGLRTWQWVVTAIVIIVLIIIAILVFRKNGPATEPAPIETIDTTSNNTLGTDGIVISDQYPGNVVYVSSVQLTKAGWVAIHKDSNGNAGDIIGYVWVNEGVNPAKITLTSPMVDGGTYYAMLHSDNGDKKWNATDDVPLKDSSGNVIMRAFKATITASDTSKG